jgi:hypothetical protein
MNIKILSEEFQLFFKFKYFDFLQLQVFLNIQKRILIQRLIVKRDILLSILYLHIFQLLSQH